MATSNITVALFTLIVLCILNRVKYRQRFELNQIFNYTVDVKTKLELKVKNQICYQSVQKGQGDAHLLISF